MEPGTDERIKCLLAPIDAHVVPRRDNAGADLKDPVVDQAHGHMKSWKHDDPSAPNVLRLARAHTFAFRQ